MHRLSKSRVDRRQKAIGRLVYTLRQKGSWFYKIRMSGCPASSSAMRPGAGRCARARVSDVPAVMNPHFAARRIARPRWGLVADRYRRVMAGTPPTVEQATAEQPPGFNEHGRDVRRAWLNE